MGVFRNPLNRNTFLPLNRNSGDCGSDVIIENSVSQKRQIRDLELPSQLSNSIRNTHMFRLKTREDAYRDVTIINPRIVGRQERSKTQFQKDKYQVPRI